MADQETKDQILEHASERYLEAGISKVSIDELAADLGMSKKTVYKFFPGKDVLLKAIVGLMTHRVQKQIQEIVSSDKPFEQKMTSLLYVIGKLLGRMSRQFVRDMQRFAPALWKEIETFRREHVLSHLREMFKQAKEEKIFREDLNTDLFYLVFVSSVEAIVNPQVLSENSFSAQEAFRGILKLLVEGALTKEAKEKYHFFDEQLDINQ